MKKFKDFITEAPLPIDWDKDFVNTQTSHTKLIKYATERAQKIGSGSSRVVFYVHDDKFGDTVLKIAKNKKGLAQNTFEREIADWHPNVTPKLFDYDRESTFMDKGKEHLWLQFDSCKKLTKKYFADKIGVSFDLYCRWLENASDRQSNLRSLNVKIDDTINDALHDHPFTYGMMIMLTDYGLPVGDLTRLSSYGIDRHGDVKLVDAGLNNDIYMNLYAK